MAACGIAHPEQPEVRCIARRKHDQHFAMHAGVPVEWPNADWVEPPRKTRSSKGQAAQMLIDLADQVPPKQTATGHQAKDEGIAQAEAGTDPAWGQRFDARLRELAATGQKFTSEDVTSVVGLPPGHPSAVGARMNAAARRGLIEKVGLATAGRENQHAAMLTEWRGV